jgi:thiamine-phosphate pyrophosphorylase
MAPFRFYLITDRLRGRHDPAVVLPALAKAGLRALQIREKDLAPAALAALCGAWQAALAGGPPVELYLNDRADLALSLGLTGVQLREDSLPLAGQAPALREQLRYGVSTHDVAGVRAAAAAGAAFATFGPVFATPSKAAYGSPVGLTALAEAAAATDLPLYALGGVTPERVGDCLAAGAAGVAAISAVWNVDDPVAALGRFASALGGL